MKAFNDTFQHYNTKSSKTPYYTIELSWDTGFTDLHYFTNDALAQHPVGASVTDGVIKNIAGTSQSLDPLRFTSTIGNINFELVDKDAAITALINTKLDGGDGLREKRVRVYMGFSGMDFADYEIIQTQIITGVIYKDGQYTINCSDVGRIEKKDIFDVAQTRLSASLEMPPTAILNGAINNSVTTLTVDRTSDFASSGAVLINDEIITYTAKPTSTTFTGCTRGTNNTTATSHLDQSTVEQTMYTLSVYDTTDFELLEHDTNYTDAPSLEVGYVKIDDEVIRYTSKTPTTFINCYRGALNTVPQAHEFDAGTEIDGRPEVDEYVYIETNAVKIIYGILLGALYGQSGKEFPASWHLNIDTIWVRNADFTEIGNDLWNTSDDSGFVLRFEGLKKQDGKAFIEKQILPLITCFMPIYADGDIGLKRSTGVVSSAGYVDILDENNIVSYSNLNHKLSAVANKYIIHYHWSGIQDDFTRKVTYIDAGSIAENQDAVPIELKFKGLHGSIHTQSTIKRIIERIRDRYASPPITLTATCLPSDNNKEPGDIVKVNVANIRDYTSDSEILNRSAEIQRAQINWITGKVSFDLFASTTKITPRALSTTGTVLYSNDTTLNGAIGTGDTTITLTDSTGFPSSGAIEIESESITYTGISSNDLTGCTRGVHGTTAVTHADTTAVHNSYYTDQGGINIKSLSSYSANSINAETLTGGATMSLGVYYHTDDLTINTSTTTTSTLNLQLLIEGHLTINGTLSSEGAGYSGGSGSIPTITAYGPGNSFFFATDRHNDGTEGFLRTTSPVGFIDYTTVYIYSGKITSILGLHETIPEFDVDYDGSSITGMPEQLVGTSGASGGGSVVALGNDRTGYAGGPGGASGGGIRIISQGGSFGVNGSINTSGGAGTSSPGSFSRGSVTINYSSGTGGAPGALHWLLDGNTSTIPSIGAHLTADNGSSAVVGTPLSDIWTKTSSVTGSVYTKYVGVSRLSNDSAYRVQFIPDNETPEAGSYDYSPLLASNLVVTSGTTELKTLTDGTVISRMRVSWTASTDKDVDHYQIQYYKTSDITTLRIIEDKPSRESTYTYINDVDDGVEYGVTIISINKWGNKSRRLSTLHTVVGKTASPSPPSAVRLRSDPIGVRIEWLNPSDKDLAIIEIYQSSANTIPANPIYRVAASRFSTNQYYAVPLHPGSSKYYWLIAVDSSKNKSTAVSATPALFKRHLPFVLNPTNTFDQSSMPLGVVGDIWRDSLTDTTYRNNGTGIPTEFTTAIEASDPANQSRFGASVALSGDGRVMAVGATGRFDTKVNQGAVYIYDRNEITGAWDERTILIASNPATGDAFGSGVGLSNDGSVLCVGAPNVNGATLDEGAVYIFRWDGVTWTQEASIITASDAAIYSYFGSDCALSGDGDVLAVGAQGRAGGGAQQGGVYIFDYDGSVWAERSTIVTASDAGNSDAFGGRVDLSSDGSVLAVGAVGWDGAAGSDQGAVYVYDWTNGSSWTERTTALTPSDAGSYDAFGGGLALTNNGAVMTAGSLYWDGTKTDQGAFYVFDWNTGTSSWDQRNTDALTASDASDYDYFGYSCAISNDGSVIAVGAFGWDGTTYGDQGAVYIFNTQWQPISDQTGSHILETFSDDLVIDGDMERSDILYWSGTSTLPEKNTSNFKFGSQSLKISSTSLVEQSYYNGDKLYIPVESDDTYRIRFWSKVVSGTAALSISFYDGNESFLSSANQTMTATTWTKKTATGLTIPSSARYMTVGLKMTVSGSAYIDAVFVKRE